jgi:hypothetical protein
LANNWRWRQSIDCRSIDEQSSKQKRAKKVKSSSLDFHSLSFASGNYNKKKTKDPSSLFFVLYIVEVLCVHRLLQLPAAGGYCVVKFYTLGYTLCE